MMQDRPIKDDPRTVFGWCMYDWANSAYVTTVAVGLLPRYFADVVVPPGGVVIRGTTVTADTLWAIIVGAATLIAFLTSPVLGAVADFSSAKKRFLLRLDRHLLLSFVDVDKARLARESRAF